MSQSKKITIKNGDRYEHKGTGVRAVVSDTASTPVGCVRLVSEDFMTKSTTTITLAALWSFWRKL